MLITLVLVTYNRLEYTKKCIYNLLKDKKEEFSLYICDNASNDGTVEFLKNELNDRRISDIIFSKNNIGAKAMTNIVWERAKTDLLGKVDNDCLVTPGWTRKLAKAHSDVPMLGAVACWHYFYSDYDDLRAAKKRQTFGAHTIHRHPWVGGTGFLLKKETFERFGLLDPDPSRGFTEYFIKMALEGYINGWYYPLILQEHMDDPLSEHTLLIDHDSIKRIRDTSWTIKTRNIQTMNERMKWRELVLNDLIYGPVDPRQYIGWRSRLRRAKFRLSRLL